MYTLKIRLEHGQENLLQTLHCNTKSDSNVIIANVQQHQNIIRDPISSNSEQQLVEVIAAENEGINIFQSKQEIKSMIQRARNNSSAKGFIYSEYKINKPPELKQERLKRIWMISKGQEFFDEVYGNIDPGLQFLKNDWFMGPFYSYDPNEELLRKNQENRDFYFDDLRKICSKDTYKEKLRLFLFNPYMELKEHQETVDLFIEYAELSQEYGITFEHMINHNIGIKEPQFYHYFFNKLKETNYRKALQCIQMAKQFCYSNFEQIDSMNKELENILLFQFESYYQSKNCSKKQIEDKLKQFELKFYQSKNKRIQIHIDEQYRKLDLKAIIHEIESFKENKCNYNSSIQIPISQQYHLNPEESDYFNNQLEQKEFKLIKPKFQNNRNNLQIITQSPNFSNDIALSEEINKLTPISSSSTSSRYIFKLNNNYNIKSNQQQKLIIPIPTINQQISPLKSLNRMKYKSIQKLRQLIFEDNIQSSVKEPLKFDSPQ
ncbi:unnamed protein product [Paramecium primaurelia]|uniref:Uncharacterized protein n=1 Tax=Paramecium primaurelia TaxID=5886 RepID=A0A8S1PTG1_PARPR|nr:unnamed protein product [Paramecium primaurelia]